MDIKNTEVDKRNSSVAGNPENRKMKFSDDLTLPGSH